MLKENTAINVEVRLAVAVLRHEGAMANFQIDACFFGQSIYVILKNVFGELGRNKNN